jgi:hypothetical protein
VIPRVYHTLRFRPPILRGSNRSPEDSFPAASSVAKWVKETNNPIPVLVVALWSSWGLAPYALLVRLAAGFLIFDLLLMLLLVLLGVVVYGPSAAGRLLAQVPSQYCSHNAYKYRTEQVPQERVRDRERKDEGEQLDLHSVLVCAAALHGVILPEVRETRQGRELGEASESSETVGTVSPRTDSCRSHSSNLKRIKRAA